MGNLATWLLGELFPFQIKTSVVDTQKYLGKEKLHFSPSKIYEKCEDNKKKIILPIPQCIFDQMKKLSLHNFYNKDKNYNAFELQLLDNYFRVLAYHSDAPENAPKVDVYVEKGKKELFNESEKTVKKKIITFKEIIEVEFEKKEFIVDKFGMIVDVIFKDKNGRKIEIICEEGKMKKEKEYDSLVAPVGAVTPHLEYLSFVYLDPFSVVPKRCKNIVKIEGKEMDLVVIPFKYKGEPIYLTRYAGNVSICYMGMKIENKVIIPKEIKIDDNNILRFESKNIEKSNKTEEKEKKENVKRMQTSVTITKNGNWNEIKEVKYQFKSNVIEFLYQPALPSFLHLKKKEKLKLSGKFVINCNSTKGCVSGIYQILKENSPIINFCILPKKIFQPVPGRSWISHFVLDNTIHFKDNNQIIFNSKWRKDKEKNADFKQLYSKKE